MQNEKEVVSFLAHGHDFHLYTYAPIDNVPEGVVMQDANDILPASMIFQYRDHSSYAGFANFFRYKLLLDRGLTSMARRYAPSKLPP